MTNKTTDDIIRELAELRRELFTLVGRISRLEQRVEEAIDAPPIERRVVPPSVVGTAAGLGEELAEGKRLIRDAKQSAQRLSRAMVPKEEREEGGGTYHLGVEDLDNVKEKP